MVDIGTLVQQPLVAGAAVTAGASVLISLVTTAGTYLVMVRRMRVAQGTAKQRIQREDFEAILEQSRTLRTELDERYQGITDAMERVEQTSVTLRNENTELRAQNALLASRLGVLEPQHALLQAKLATLEPDVAKLRCENEEMRIETERMRRESSALYLLVEQYGIKVPEWIRRHGDRLRVVSEPAGENATAS